MGIFGTKINIPDILFSVEIISKFLIFFYLVHVGFPPLVSAIANIRNLLRDLLHALSSLTTKYKALMKRANSPPGIPVPNPTSPYWLDDPPFPELVDRQDDIPAQADLVIIGSGIAGVSAAKAVLELWPGNGNTPSSSDGSDEDEDEDEDYVDGGKPRALLVVVLEARQICSGATGRNGGHIKSAPYEVYSDMKKKLGHERACDIVRFQMRHLPCLVELGKEFPLAEAREVETVDLFLEEKDLDEAEGHAKEVMEAVPDYTADVLRGDEARKKVCL